MKKLNGELHQPSGIRYVSRSFSVRCLVSIAYRKGLVFAVTLSVVVPQAIGIFHRNNKIYEGVREKVLEFWDNHSCAISDRKNVPGKPFLCYIGSKACPTTIFSQRDLY